MVSLAVSALERRRALSQTYRQLVAWFDCRKQDEPIPEGRTTADTRKGPASQ